MNDCIFCRLDDNRSGQGPGAPLSTDMRMHAKSINDAKKLLMGNAVQNAGSTRILAGLPSIFIILSSNDLIARIERAFDGAAHTDTSRRQ